jgi:hypothetical protein
MCGFRWLGHSKHSRDTDRFILIPASEPYVKQYGVLCLTNAQLRDYNSEMEIEYGRRSCGAILEFLGIEFG